FPLCAFVSLSLCVSDDPPTMTLRDIYLICFAAGAVIHAVQTVLVANLSRNRTGFDRGEAVVVIANGVGFFFWQFGEFAPVLVSTLNEGVPSGSSFYFRAANFMRDGSLVCFPLLLSYICLHIPKDVPRARPWLLLGQYLRFPLWPWTVITLAT